VATALMATGKAIDVDRRSLPLLLDRCFLPQTHTTPWGINSDGPGRVESRLACEGMGAGRRIQSMPAFDPKSFGTAVKDATG